MEHRRAASRQLRTSGMCGRQMVTSTQCGSPSMLPPSLPLSVFLAPHPSLCPSLHSIKRGLVSYVEDNWPKDLKG